MNMHAEYSGVAAFHGHSCPGLAIGYRMIRAALEALRGARAGDEELVAIVENNACGVDAVQAVAGCTFGKGNLIFRDFGKHAYTLYSRAGRRGVRVVFHGRGIPEGLRDSREAFTAWVLAAPAEAILAVSPVEISEPEPARIHTSRPCAACGEQVMETRLKDVGGKKLCIPCAERAAR